MISLENRRIIRKNLPHGKLKEIGQLAGVNPVNISQWFKGVFNSERIEAAVTEIYHECQKEERRRARIIDTAHHYLTTKNKCKEELIAA